MYLLLNLNVVSNLIIKYLPKSLININYKIENSIRFEIGIIIIIIMNIFLGVYSSDQRIYLL